MATTIDANKIWESVHEANCVVCDHVEMTTQETPDGPQPVINCRAESAEQCYVVICEVERLTP